MGILMGHEFKDKVDEDNTAHHYKKTFQILEVLLTITIVVNIILILLFINQDRWDPLGDYPVQVVTNRSEQTTAHDGEVSLNPTVRVPNDINAMWPSVNIEATKCADEEVTVKGQTSWRQVNPPGFVYALPPGVALRSLGCQVFKYRNDIPTEVKAHVLDLARSGIRTTSWQIGGQETPVNKMTGRNGGTRLYESQNFVIVVDP